MKAQKTTPEPGPECCTPEAQKTVAATLGFADSAGIQLGMTPEQALEAAKKFNPQFKFHVIKARMEAPGAPGGYTLAPRYIVVGTEGVPRFPTFPKPFALADGSADEIVLEFTLPPSPPLLAKISRRVSFATGQPVMASTLIEALEKKYGKESLNANNSLYWVFDSSGKMATVPATSAARSCVPVAPTSGFSWQAGLPAPGDDLERPAPEPVNLETIGVTPNSPGFSSERAAACQGITILQASELGGNVPSTSRQMAMETSLQSGSLLYASRRATYDWIAAKRADLKAKADAAAKNRAAPKL
ncbi:MAG TPA: hypothetical protein VGM11_02710 [Acidobacteriaceae bacterium]